MTTKEEHIERILLRTRILWDKKVALDKFYAAAYSLPCMPAHAQIWEEFDKLNKEFQQMWKDHKRDVVLLAQGIHGPIPERTVENV